jgi:hypothetical protein
MKHIWSILLICSLGVAMENCAMGAAGDGSAAAQERVTVRPTDTGQALINPEMGWTMMFYSNIPGNYGSKLAPSDTLEWFPGCSTVYLRLPWAYIEPEEGKFNWAILDTPAQRWIARGKYVAIRITSSESWLRFATPQWVKNAGAKGVDYDFGKGPRAGGAMWDPVFDDPIFLEKLDHFLAALAAHYDGNPNVAFVDVGSYGLWGEGHTMMSSQVPDNQAEPIIRKHIDLYLKHFQHTLLAFNDDLIGSERQGRHFPLSDYAISRGLTLRDDSILVQPPPRSWFHAEMAQEFWPKTPVIVEHEHFGPSKGRGAWGDGSLLLKAVEDYHASFLSIHWWPQIELAENRAMVDRINLRLGYRIQLQEVSWPASSRIGHPFTVEWKWANAGVAPCYPGGFAALTLKDDQGGIAAVLVDEGIDMRSLDVGLPGQAPARSSSGEFCAGLIAPTTNPGSYDVYVSVGRRDGTPQIAMPLAGEDGQRRYKIGRMTLTE